jgi:hypothetical protein
MTKKEDYKSTPEPSYYTGTKFGYSARNIVEDFNLGNPAEQDIQKAINHLHFELDKLYKKSETLTGGLAT